MTFIVPPGIPLQDIRNTRRIASAIFQGALYNSSALEQILGVTSVSRKACVIPNHDAAPKARQLIEICANTSLSNLSP